MESKFRMLSNVKLKVNGVLIQEIHNIVTTVGLTYVAARLKDSGSPTQMSHMGVGSGTTTPAALGDTTLETPMGARVALTSITAVTASIEYIGSFSGATYTGAISEAGIFNALSGGTMLAHVYFTGITLLTTDSLTITWTHTFANA